MLSSALNRFVLVPDTRPSSGAAVRRYRLARLAVNPEPGVRRKGFDHLKRTYD
jgi:hypothetical protein